MARVQSSQPFHTSSAIEIAQGAFFRKFVKGGGKF